MKSITRLVIILITAGVFFPACKKGTDAGKMIPKDALIVLHLNTKSLSSKITWNEITQTGWYKEVYSDTAAKPWLKKIMDNPENSGIDFKEGLYAFAQKNASSGQVVFEGTVKDASAFEAFNKNMATDAATAKDGDLKTLLLKNESVVCWSNSKFAYIFNTPNMPDVAMTGDSMQPTAPVLSTPGQLSQICKSLFTLSSGNSLEKNERFANLLKEDGDVHFWQNTEQFIKNSPQSGMLSMLKLDLFFKENISTMTATFNDGKINVHQKMYASAELTDLLKKYGGGSVSSEMIKNIPSENITGMLALHFKPEGIRELIKLTGMDGFLNMFISQQGFTLDDFVKANKGDVLLTFTDFTMKPDSFAFKGDRGRDTMFSSFTPDVNVLFAVSVGDNPSFDKLMNAGKKMSADMHKDSGIYYARNDKYFALGNKQQYVTKYVGGNSNKFEFPGKLDDHPVAFYINIQKILNEINPRPRMDSVERTVLAESKSMWSDVFLTGGEYKDDGFVINTEINLQDKKTNSLKQLNHYADVISKAVMEKKKKEKEGW
jgi:hypothetical protein